MSNEQIIKAPIQAGEEGKHKAAGILKMKFFLDLFTQSCCVREIVVSISK